MEDRWRDVRLQIFHHPGHRISITVPREPARAGIDPASKLIDRTRQDNIVDVKIQNGDAL
jgi:hypothetical protein